MSFKFFLFVFTLVSIAFSTETLSLEGEKVLKEFNSTKYMSFEEVVTDDTLVVLFQPNCSACKKQIKNLKCLSGLISKTILVGSLGTEEQLKRSYLKKRVDLKGFFVQKESLNAIGFEDFLAPQVIYYSFKKNLKFLGYKSCKKLKRAIEEVKNDEA